MLQNTQLILFSFFFMLEGTLNIDEGLCSQTIIQKAVDDAISKQSWERLRVLFLGGGGPFLACPGEGGLAGGCDASQVPLDLLIQSQVEEKLCLVSTLLEAGAHVNGLPLCEKPPLLVALETEEFGIANELIEAGADVACAFNQPHLQTKVVNLKLILILLLSVGVLDVQFQETVVILYPLHGRKVEIPRGQAVHKENQFSDLPFGQAVNTFMMH